LETIRDRASDLPMKADDHPMNPLRPAPVLAGIVRVASPVPQRLTPAVHAVLQRTHSPRQLSLPLRPRG